MAIEKVREYFSTLEEPYEIKEFSTSSATVQLAALALQIESNRIAKTLSFYGKDGICILVVTAGDAKIDNRKFKEEFGIKAKMVCKEEVETLTGHPVGGVCPFANPDASCVYLDVSLQKYKTVFPACGSSSSAVEISPFALFDVANAMKWIDVCK